MYEQKSKYTDQYRYRTYQVGTVGTGTVQKLRYCTGTTDNRFTMSLIQVTKVSYMPARSRRARHICSYLDMFSFGRGAADTDHPQELVDIWGYQQNNQFNFKKFPIFSAFVMSVGTVC